jgi:hypothetical protein
LGGSSDDAAGRRRWVEGDGMKYVITWEAGPNASEETLARSLQVFGKWSPAEGSNFLQFLDRIDGRGGFAVVETEDPTLIMRDTAIFGAFLEFNVYPVLDIEEGTRILNEAAEFRRNAG